MTYRETINLASNNLQQNLEKLNPIKDKTEVKKAIKYSFEEETKNDYSKEVHTEEMFEVHQEIIEEEVKIPLNYKPKVETIQVKQIEMSPFERQSQAFSRESKVTQETKIESLISSDSNSSQIKESLTPKSFKIEAILGKGAFGEVYLATLKKTGQ